MNEPLQAAWEVSQFLAQHGIPYVIIGGLAVQEWGGARLTVDADFTIAAPLEGSAEIVQLITAHFPSRISDPQAMAQRARMILVRASNGVDVDISLGLPGYEDELFRRAVMIEFEPDQSLRVCSAEDLVIHKAVAGRPQDVVDIETVVLRQGRRLDVGYIRRWLSEFSDVLANPEVPERFEQAYRKLTSK
jgi:hypothetical protein